MLVEFQRQLRLILYFDWAWCMIDTLTGSCIILGKEWLEERQASINPDRKECIVHPPHLSGTFIIPSVLLASTTDNKEALLVEIYEAPPSFAEEYEEQCLKMKEEVLVVATNPIKEKMHESTSIKVLPISIAQPAAPLQLSTSKTLVQEDFCKVQGKYQPRLLLISICIKPSSNSQKDTPLILEHFKTRG